MAQLLKQKVKLTNLLREHIRKLRKTYNKRGDILSKELNRGASYISQLENGKINDIEFDLLNDMFQHIIGLSDNDYDNYMQKYIYNIIKDISKETLFTEYWLHIFVMQNFKINIPGNIIDIIKNKLQKLDCTSEYLAKKINENIALREFDMKNEFNKLYLSITASSYDDYYIHVSVKYNLPVDYVSKILSKEYSQISYIYMYGIIQNLYILENKDDLSGAIKKAKKILFDHGFYNAIEIYENLHDITHSQKPLNVEKSNDENLFTFYDDIIVNYNEKFNQLRDKAFKKLGYAFDRYKDENFSYACETLEKIIQNMDCDLGLIMAILSSPLYNIPYSYRSEFWEIYKKTLEKFLQNKFLQD